MEGVGVKSRRVRSVAVLNNSVSNEKAENTARAAEGLFDVNRVRHVLITNGEVCSIVLEMFVEICSPLYAALMGIHNQDLVLLCSIEDESPGTRPSPINPDQNELLQHILQDRASVECEGKQGQCRQGIVEQIVISPDNQLGIPIVFEGEILGVITAALPSETRIQPTLFSLFARTVDLILRYYVLAEEYDCLSNQRSRMAEYLSAALDDLRDLRPLATLGLMYGEILHYASNRLGMVKALAQNIGAGYYDEDPKLIKSAAERIIKNTDALLESLTESLETPENSLIDLHELLTDVIRSKKLSAYVAVSVDFGVADPVIHAPLKQLRQVFLVLLQNALDAMKGIGGMSGMINISTNEHGHGEFQTIEVNISDTGRGIPQELLEDLFSFSVGSEGRYQSHRLGLGLAWARSFLYSHGGEIRCETSNEMGTTFRLYLPRVFKMKLV